MTLERTRGSLSSPTPWMPKSFTSKTRPCSRALLGWSNEQFPLNKKIWYLSLKPFFLPVLQDLFYFQPFQNFMWPPATVGAKIPPIFSTPAVKIQSSQLAQSKDGLEDKRILDPFPGGAEGANFGKSVILLLLLDSTNCIICFPCMIFSKNHEKSQAKLTITPGDKKPLSIIPSLFCITFQPIFRLFSRW